MYPVNAGGVHGLEPRGRILTLMALLLSAYLVLLARLAPVLQMTPAEIQAKLATTRKFVYLARRVPAAVAQQLDGLRLPGIGKVAETQRAYVDGGVAGTSLAANLLGFANDDGKGNY